ncbi:MAG: hypothetical protein ACOCWT_00600 [Desulfohalobiaceae bacterium]
MTALLSVFFMGCAVHAGQPFEYCCCLGDRARAEQMADHLESRVAGLKAEVREVVISKTPGVEEVGYAIELQHPDMDQEAICAALGRVECPEPAEEECL